jgi:hypothetical protein
MLGRIKDPHRNRWAQQQPASLDDMISVTREKLANPTMISVIDGFPGVYSW